MLKISKLTDYATILLIHLDRHRKTVSSTVLSVETGIPEPTVAKILKILTRSTLVKSRRGAKSGYHLESSLKEITLAQVVTSIDGPIDLVNCNPESCRIIYSQCDLQGHWSIINNQIKHFFETITLEELKNNIQTSSNNKNL
ncbi:HTH-type transcriptional repressor NsrR [Commensalibacter sp. Nvir]|uniref:RrF2 family transcriptional regulator n=1 Tax=Commensalibacter sp. Nvir TaxID=3069817 RepID=UPI002D49BF2D|nr:HTH-type transcriptional repressor NsrR [Commensalibacter sp. Nvir]